MCVVRPDGVYTEKVCTHSVIGSSIRPVQQLRTWCVISAYVYEAGTSLEGKMANFPLMCSLFRINSVLKIEIEQLEEKLDGIKNWHG